MDSSQNLGHSHDSCTSCVRLSILPQAVGRQDSTSCPSTSCYSGPFYMPSAGESEGARVRLRGGRKGGTTSGTPLPSDSSPYYHPDCKSETKQQQRLAHLLWLHSVCLLCLLEGSLHGLDALSRSLYS